MFNLRHLKLYHLLRPHAHPSTYASNIRRSERLMAARLRKGDRTNSNEQMCTAGGGQLISRAPFEADTAALVARRVKKWGRCHSYPGRRVSIARSRDEPRMRRRGGRPYWLPTRTAIADESPDKNSCTAFESAPSETWPQPPASAAVLFRPTGSPADPLRGMSPRQTSSRGFLVAL
jgi:hypothetical protein